MLTVINSIENEVKNNDMGTFHRFTKAAGAEKIYQELSKYFNCEFDDRGNIGKRYRRQDEIGTPFCVTYDFDSETDGCVTVRERDSMEQVRIKIDELDAYFADKFTFEVGK